jgi:hypothetical protein
MASGRALNWRAGEGKMPLMTTDRELGEAFATLRRSSRGIAVGTVVVVGVFGALIAWNLVRRPGPMGLLMVAVIAVVSIPAVLIFLSAPHTVTIHHAGISVRALWRQPVRIPWANIVSVRMWRAPLGSHPTIVSLRLQGAPSLTLSAAEYDGIDRLIEALVGNVPERVEDRRAEP